MPRAYILEYARSVTRCVALARAGVRPWPAEPARKAARKPLRAPHPPQSRASRRPRPSGAAPAATASKIVAAFLALLAEKRIERIGLAEIAEQAGVSLAQLRGEFASHARASSPPISRPSTALCSPKISATWPKSRRASGCSTC